MGIRKFSNLINQRFGRLVAIEHVGSDGRRAALWKCVCDCGTTKVIPAADLRRWQTGRQTKSCGCLQKEIMAKFARKPTHGQSGNRYQGRKISSSYSSWTAMKQRCLGPNSPNYPRYGGAGVTVCDRWLSFENFFADMGERPQGTSLGRFGDVGNYQKSNCAWQTRKEQIAEQKTKRLLKAVEQIAA
jgi:hypothetical protein